MTVKLKRVYEDPADDDGHRILVDRIWPRGISRDDAHIEEWLREIAPTTELRTWFDHEVTRWSEFRRRYLSELKEHRDILRRLAKLAKKEPVTLLFAASDETHNNAVVVKQYLAMLGSR